MFDLVTSIGVLFTYKVEIHDKTNMQIVTFVIDSHYTAAASRLNVNVATLAVIGKSVEQALVEHVEHYERMAIK